MSVEPNTAPLIVTAQPDLESFAVLNDMRRRYFPPSLNKVPAHISLFHHLPGLERDAVDADVAMLCRGLAPMDLQPAGVRLLGRGVALAYEADALARLHAGLADRWDGWLTAQDRQKFKAHITIQNKVEPAMARDLYERLRVAPPTPCRVDRIVVWRYLGGRWELESSHPLTRDVTMERAAPPSGR